MSNEHKRIENFITKYRGISNTPMDLDSDLLEKHLTLLLEAKNIMIPLDPNQADNETSSSLMDELSDLTADLGKSAAEIRALTMRDVFIKLAIAWCENDESESAPKQQSASARIIISALRDLTSLAPVDDLQVMMDENELLL